MDTRAASALQNLSIGQVIKAAQLWLPEAETARLDMEILISRCLGKPRAWLLAWPDTCLTAAQAISLQNDLQRRAAGEPLAYVVGHKEFWSLSLEITPGVLVPRPETERLTELALERVPVDQPWRIVDFGTGSGAIALAIAQERPCARVVGVDISRQATHLAKHNARCLELNHVHFVQANWGSCLHYGCAELIVSNPPYIAENDPCLQNDGVRCEPDTALVSGPDGLRDIRTLTAQAAQILRPGGWLLIEHGMTQGAAVREILANAKFDLPTTWQDYAGRERISGGKMPDIPLA